MGSVIHTGGCSSKWVSDILPLTIVKKGPQIPTYGGYGNYYGFPMKTTEQLHPLAAARTEAIIVVENLFVLFFSMELGIRFGAFRRRGQQGHVGAMEMCWPGWSLLASNIWDVHPDLGWFSSSYSWIVRKFLIPTIVLALLHDPRNHLGLSENGGPLNQWCWLPNYVFFGRFRSAWIFISRRCPSCIKQIIFNQEDFWAEEIDCNVSSTIQFCVPVLWGGYARVR